MTRTISSTYASLVTLSSLADNPTTITSAALLNAGLYAAAVASAWMVTNAGSILHAGVTLQSSGTVANTGSITATADAGSGVYFATGGDVTNTTGGSIAGGYRGVLINAGEGTVVNGGSITGTLGGGIRLNSGGSVTNALGASITGIDGGGVGVVGGAGTVLNAGQIAGSKTSGLGGTGVGLLLGGYVSNAASGTITGLPNSGVYVEGAAGTVFNDGLIADTGTNGEGIHMVLGGSVYNAAHGTITAALLSGVLISGAQGVVTNAGLVASYGTSGQGIALQSGGSVTNLSSGTIDAAENIGVLITGGIGSVDNAGHILGGGPKPAIQLSQGGSVTNHVGGTIVAGPTHSAVYVLGGAATIINDGVLGSNNSRAINLLAAGTVVNAGTIIGGSVGAIQFAAGFYNQLTIEPGAIFVGNVNGGNTFGSTIHSAIDLASAASEGTLSGLGSQFIGFADTTIDAGASWSLTGAVPSGETIVFGGNGAYLHLDSPTSVAGIVTNFDTGETIDLKGIDPVSVNYSGSILHFSGGSFGLSLGSGGTVHASASGDGAAISLLCFCANTLILTPSGERPVQELAAGDMVTTCHGAVRRIVWIGTGRVLATRGRRNAATPVKVCKGAIADNVPCRDLRVTKGHSLFIDNVLIPVEELINHHSIIWDDLAQEVELYHIELETHDVLVADGVPAESYRNDGNRWLFRNYNSGSDLPPQTPCAPVLTDGPLVDTIWRRLLQRCGPRKPLPMSNDPALHLLVDGIRLDPIERHDAMYAFRLAARPRRLRIISRTAIPQELGFVRDARPLGVAVRRIVLAQARSRRVIEADAASLADGYYAFEPDNGIRWTKGDAAVPTELFTGMTCPGMLVLYLGCEMRYLEATLDLAAA